MKRFVREPVVQFLAIGALLFAVNWLVGPGDKEVNKEAIVVSAAVIESLEARFETVWKRPPTADERQGLIRDHLAEETLYREAQNLGLDRDDVVIRRRLRQKMEFLLEDSLEDSDEASLRAYFEKHEDRNAADDSYGFTQFFLGPNASSAHQAELRTLAPHMNTRLPVPLDTIAQPILLPETVEASAKSTIDGVFGEGFAASIFIGLQRLRTDVLVRIDYLNSGTETLRATPEAPIVLPIGRKSLAQVALSPQHRTVGDSLMELCKIVLGSEFTRERVGDERDHRDSVFLG